MGKAFSMLGRPTNGGSNAQESMLVSASAIVQLIAGASMKSVSYRNSGVRGDDSGVDSTDEVDSSDAARERGGVIGGTGEMDIAAKGVVNEEAPCDASETRSAVSSSTASITAAAAACSPVDSCKVSTRPSWSVLTRSRSFSLTLALSLSSSCCPSKILHHSMSASTLRPLVSEPVRRGLVGIPALRAPAAESESALGYGLVRTEVADSETVRRREGMVKGATRK